VILPLYTTLMRPHLEFVPSHGVPNIRRTLNLLEWVRTSAMKMVKGLEHFSYEERLRELRWFDLDRRRLSGYFIVAFQYISWGL